MATKEQWIVGTVAVVLACGGCLASFPDRRGLDLCGGVLIIVALQLAIMLMKSGKTKSKFIAEKEK